MVETEQKTYDRAEYPRMLLAVVKDGASPDYQMASYFRRDADQFSGDLGVLKARLNAAEALKRNPRHGPSRERLHRSADWRITDRVREAQQAMKENAEAIQSLEQTIAACEQSGKRAAEFRQHLDTLMSEGRVRLSQHNLPLFINRTRVPDGYFGSGVIVLAENTNFAACEAFIADMERKGDRSERYEAELEELRHKHARLAEKIRQLQESRLDPLSMLF